MRKTTAVAKGQSLAEFMKAEQAGEFEDRGERVTKIKLSRPKVLADDDDEDGPSGPPRKRRRYRDVFERIEGGNLGHALREVEREQENE